MDVIKGVNGPSQVASFPFRHVMEEDKTTTTFQFFRRNVFLLSPLAKFNLACNFELQSIEELKKIEQNARKKISEAFGQMRSLFSFLLLLPLQPNWTGLWSSSVKRCYLSFTQRYFETFAFFDVWFKRCPHLSVHWSLFKVGSELVESGTERKPMMERKSNFFGDFIWFSRQRNVCYVQCATSSLARGDSMRSSEDTGWVSLLFSSLHQFLVTYENKKEEQH